jgi:copper chaperone CopZ
METLEIFVENIKCGGCINGIKNALLAFPGVKSVEIILDEEKVIIQGDHLEKSVFVTKMDSMGYPGQILRKLCDRKSDGLTRKKAPLNLREALNNPSSNFFYVAKVQIRKFTSLHTSKYYVAIYKKLASSYLTFIRTASKLSI